MPVLNFIGRILCTVLAIVTVMLQSSASKVKLSIGILASLQRLSWFSSSLKTSCFLLLFVFYLLLL